MKHILSVRLIVTAFVFFVLLLLEGCISVPRSPAPHFYTLQPIKEIGTALADANSLTDAVVGIGPVTLPEYLNRPQIVTKSGDNTIEFAQFERWAESLDEEIGRVIARDFSILLPGTGIEIFPWNSIIPIRYQVIMEVIQLDCRLDGEAVLCMQWSILDVREKKMLLTKRSEYRKTVGNGNYAGLAQAISAICESLSRDIAQTLTKLRNS